MKMEAIKKVYNFLEEAKTFFLATVEGDQPRVRPYGAFVMFEDKLYIMAFARTNATLQVEQNPKAEICAFKGKTLRIECRLVEDDRQEVKDAMLEKMQSLKAGLGEKGENAVMLRVTDATATFYQIMEPIETVTF